MDGQSESWQQLVDFVENEAEREMKALMSPIQVGVARILIVRHGMGDHNTFGGVGSVVNEDAGLNETGVAQAELIGRKLREVGALGRVDLVVISPFTRALQTALYMLGEEMLSTPVGTPAGSPRRKGMRIPRPQTIVHPLCAEDTKTRSHLYRGNRGSTAEELSVKPEFEVFDWGEVKRYCEYKRVSAKDAAQEGKWWHHGPHMEETEGSFKRRVGELRRWLGQLPTLRRKGDPSPRVLVISHGGVMAEGFEYPNAPNCGFRVFDVLPDGSARRVADGEWLKAGASPEPPFKVLSVVQQPARVGGHLVYDVEIAVGPHTFFKRFREGELREALHDPVKAGLSQSEYERLQLSGKFPRWAPLGRPMTEPSSYLQDYLEQLAVATGDPGFPGKLMLLVDNKLLDGRLQRQCEAAAAAAAATSAYAAELRPPAVTNSSTCNNCCCWIFS